MKTMNHAEYQKNLKKMTEAQLRYIAQDASEALRAYPMSENASYYADEVNYACQELSIRTGRFDAMRRK